MAKIEFIIPTYSRVNHLVTILGSLKAQTSPDWKAHVVADCPPDDIQEGLKNVVEFFNDDRIKLTILPDRYNDWGHTPRQYGLDNATEEWVCMSGEDNYYVPVFVEKMLKGGENHHFVFCDMVHNWANQEYIPIKSTLQYGTIDIGNFICKTNMGKRIKLQKEFEHADWLFIQEFQRKFEHAKIYKINGVLYVHN